MATEIEDIHEAAEMRMRTIAREIAMGILGVEDILNNHHVDAEGWEVLARNPRFCEMLSSERSTWNSPLNTRERIDVKTLVLLEQNLITMNTLLNDTREPASARVELFKALQKGAGIGLNITGPEQGQRVSITINMGADKQLKVEHKMGPVIEHEPAYLEAAE